MTQNNYKFPPSSDWGWYGLFAFFQFITVASLYSFFFNFEKFKFLYLLFSLALGIFFLKTKFYKNFFLRTLDAWIIAVIFCMFLLPIEYSVGTIYSYPKDIDKLPYEIATLIFISIICTLVRVILIKLKFKSKTS